MIDIELLNQSVEDMRSFLKDGLIGTDIWRRKDGLSLAGLNHQPAAVALFTEIVTSMQNALESSGFPKLNRYFMLDLEANKTVLVIRHGTEMLQGILLDTTKANLGMLLSVVLPRALEQVAKAKGQG